MTRLVWRIGTDTPHYTADDATGEGAKRSGGRWNRKGIPVIYSAESIALAVLETFVHLDSSSLPFNRFLVRIEVPDKIWKKATILHPSSLEVGWDAEPPGKISLDAGDEWLTGSGSLLLRVPSVIVPLECNVLINPQHPEAMELKFEKIQKWTYDARMVKSRKR